MNFLEGIIYMLWRGIAIGIIISAPMGPVGILCVQRTLEKGRRTGFFTGVGASISDLIYCLLTGFGLSLIEDFLKANQNIIQLVGSAVLIVFGIYLFKSNPARKLKKPDAARSSRKRDVLQGFLFTFSNPLIIFLIIGLFARFNFLLPEINWIQYIIGYVSIIGGALLWWWTITFFVDKVRNHFNLRSMWLVNRITGSIIMIFALVGIFTAVSGMANAASHRVEYLNSSRGFGSLQSDTVTGKPLTINKKGETSSAKYLFADSPDSFSLSFRSAAKTPLWGISLINSSHELKILFTEKEGNRYDDIYAPVLDITAMTDGRNIAAASIQGDFSSCGGWNSFRLRNRDGSLVLAGGKYANNPILSLDMPPFYPDSIGFIVEKNGSLAVDYISLELPDIDPRREGEPRSHFAMADVRDLYFARSTDKLEGVWEIFDRSFDETRLRLGGNYRLAIVDDGDSYGAYYLSGASKNAAQWNAGDLKARLVPTSFKNVFDVAWINPASNLIEGEIKAQFSEPDLLTLQFVDHDSQLRLRKIKEK